MSLAENPRAWNYAGVPYTDWSYDPFMLPVPAKPVEWPGSAHAGYYYIAPDSPNSTDVVRPGEPVDLKGKRFGCPDLPRKSLPLTSKTTNSFPAGTVFWLKGGNYATAYETGRDWSMSIAGTATAPFWIYGDPDDKPVFGDLRIILYASQYGFIENILWDSAPNQIGCVRLNRPDQNGETHHIAIRNCTIQNRKYLSKGELIAISAPTTATNANLHDIVAYKITFRNNGHGVDWDLVDADVHGYKINGIWNGNRAYRIWIIGNEVIPGSTPDSIDGYFKGLSGSFVQVGDQLVTQGNVDHVYIGGNRVKGARQSAVGTKRSADVIASGNVCVDLVPNETSQGQAFNTKYDRQDHIWFIGNYSKNTDAGFIRGAVTSSGAGGPDTENPDDSRVYVIGNVFTDMMRSEQASEWRIQGISLHDLHGKVYIVNNIVHNSVYGVYWAPSTSRQNGSSELHIYNNIFSNIHATGIDPLGGVPIYLSSRTGTGSGGARVFTENNLFQTFRIVDGSKNYTNLDKWNNDPDDPDGSGAALSPVNHGNLVGDPGYLAADSGDFRLPSRSIAADAGVRIYTTNPATDVYQQFVDRYEADPDFPGNVADVWPRDLAGRARVVGSAIDIGPHEGESGSIIKPPPPTGPKVDPIRP